MKPEIRTFKPDDEFYIAEGCHIVELCNDEHDPALSIARARVEPGVTTKWHALKGTAERYVIVEGIGLAEVADRPAQQVAAGDTVIIPPDCRQRIANTGTGDLVFLALCTPRFRPENYIDLNTDSS